MILSLVSGKSVLNQVKVHELVFPDCQKLLRNLRKYFALLMSSDDHPVQVSAGDDLVSEGTNTRACF